jgi:hypothetical protein
LKLTEWHEQHFVIPKPDYLRLKRLGRFPRVDVTYISDASIRTFRLNHKTNDLSDLTVNANRIKLLKMIHVSL